MRLVDVRGGVRPPTPLAPLDEPRLVAAVASVAAVAAVASCWSLGVTK